MRKFLLLKGSNDVIWSCDSREEKRGDFDLFFTFKMPLIKCWNTLKLVFSTSTHFQWHAQFTTVFVSFTPHCHLLFSALDKPHLFSCHGCSLIILSIHPPTYQLPFSLIVTFLPFLVLSSSHPVLPPTSVFPTIFMSSSLFIQLAPLSVCLSLSLHLSQQDWYHWHWF